MIHALIFLVATFKVLTAVCWGFWFCGTCDTVLLGEWFAVFQSGIRGDADKSLSRPGRKKAAV